MQTRIAAVMLAFAVVSSVTAAGDESKLNAAAERERQVVEWCSGYWELYALNLKHIHKDDLYFLAASHTQVPMAARYAICTTLTAAPVSRDTEPLLRVALARDLPMEHRQSFGNVELARLKMLSGPLMESMIQVELSRTGLVAKSLNPAAMDAGLAKAVHHSATSCNLALTPEMAKGLVGYRLDYARLVTKPYHAALDRFEQELKSGVTEKQFTFLAEATGTLDRQTGAELTDSRKKARQIITDAYRATTDSEKALRHEAEVRLAAETAELKQIRQQFEDRLNSILAE